MFKYFFVDFLQIETFNVQYLWAVNTHNNTWLLYQWKSGVSNGQADLEL